MKRVLSLALVATVLLGCLGLSSCAEVSVDSLDGMTPGEYLTELLNADAKVERYDVVEGMRIEVKALFVPLYDANFERLYAYSYDGDNESLIMTESTKIQLKDSDFSSILDEYDGDVWYVDGVCYIDGRLAKEKYESSASSIGKSEHLKTLIKLLKTQSENVVCYENDGARRFVLELTDPELMEMDVDCMREVYTVSVSPDGLIERVLIECITDGIVTSTTSINLNYVYEGLSPVVAPIDADEYEES